jgi:hypothetical protein
MTDRSSPEVGRTPRQVRFLVVGLARSGTTFVQRLASEIVDVWVPRETHFWSRSLGADGRFAARHLSPADVRAVIEQMQQPGEPIHLSADEAARVLAGTSSGGCTPWELFVGLVDVLSPDGPTTLGEKTPGHATITTRLLSTHPHLKVIVVVRDPRAIFASALEVPWGVRDCQRLAWRWRLVYERMSADLDAFGAHRVLLVRYEDVVTDPSGFQRDVAAFLGVPLEISPVGSQELFLTHETWKQRAVESPDPDRVDAWRTQLSPTDTTLIDQITAPVADRFGYVPANRAATAVAVDAEALWKERQIAARFDVSRGGPRPAGGRPGARPG